MRALDLGEGSSAPTSGVNAPRLPEREQLADCRADELRVEPQQPAEVEALDADVPADEQAGLVSGHVPRPSRARGAAEGPQAGDPLREELAADGVDDDVDLQVLRQLLVEIRLRRAEPGQTSSFSAEPAAATTCAPNARASCTAAVPTPPAAACTSTRAGREARLPRQRDVGRQERQQERAPSANEAWSGSVTTCARSTAASSA